MLEETNLIPEVRLVVDTMPEPAILDMSEAQPAQPVQPVQLVQLVHLAQPAQPAQPLAAQEPPRSESCSASKYRVAKG